MLERLFKNMSIFLILSNLVTFRAQKHFDTEKKPRRLLNKEYMTISTIQVLKQQVCESSILLLNYFDNTSNVKTVKRNIPRSSKQCDDWIVYSVR